MDDLAPGTPVALAVADGRVIAVWDGGTSAVEALRPDLRWVWWSARDVGPWAHGVERCWDLAAVGGLVHGLRRSDPPAVWAAAHALALPAPSRGAPDLFGVGGPVVDGQLVWTTAEDATVWAGLALEVQRSQALSLDGLALRTAYAESAAAALCTEMESAGLPFSVDVAGRLLDAILGGDEEERLRALVGDGVDLRSPEQVRAMLARHGIDVPDTRSHRLEAYATSPVVSALLAWRKADRVATTYGRRWLDENVRGGRLRGPWVVADGGAGRMTAGAGLHNMPAEMRPAVVADPGHVFVGADLGQVEPRVLAAVSGDRAFAEACRSDDLYAPVAAKLGVDRPTAKVAVLAAMYGQTSGAAGSALKDLDRAYPTAMAHLRDAERIGREGGSLRTHGGRLIDFDVSLEPSSRGRYARNAVVQGAAAELFKAWAATVRAGVRGLGGEVVLCLHDELLLHVPMSESVAAQALLADALQQTAGWWAPDVRFVTDVRTGPDWPSVH